MNKYYFYINKSQKVWSKIVGVCVRYQALSRWNIKITGENIWAQLWLRRGKEAIFMLTVPRWSRSGLFYACLGRGHRINEYIFLARRWNLNAFCLERTTWKKLLDCHSFVGVIFVIIIYDDLRFSWCEVFLPLSIILPNYFYEFVRSIKKIFFFKPQL